MTIASKLMSRFQTQLPSSCKPDFIGKEPNFDIVAKAKDDVQLEEQLEALAKTDERDGDKVDVTAVGINGEIDGMVELYVEGELITTTVLTDPNGKPLVPVGSSTVFKGCNFKRAPDVHDYTTYSIGCKSLEQEHLHERG